MKKEDKLMIIGFLSLLNKMGVLTKFFVLGQIGLFGADDTEFINDWISNAETK